jgi:Flp pilus assembly protein TadG
VTARISSRHRRRVRPQTSGTRNRRSRSKDCTERGSATVEFVIAVSAMMLLLLATVQIALWYHTRAVAQTAARHGLDHLRTVDGTSGEAVATAADFLRQSGAAITHPRVDAVRTPDRSIVSVRGDVMSVLPGVELTVSVTVDAPTERLEP